MVDAEVGNALDDQAYPARFGLYEIFPQSRQAGLRAIRVRAPAEEGLKRRHLCQKLFRHSE